MSKKGASMADVAATIPEPESTPAPESAPTSDRPDWLLSNFTNVEDQAKAYVELRKTFGAQKGAPEQYEWGDLAQQLDLDNDHIKNLQVWGKENRLSQEAMSAIGKTMIDYIESKRPDPDEEIKRLGNDGVDKVKRVQNWIRNVADPAKADEMLKKLPFNAETVEFFDEVRQRHIHSMTRVPSTTDIPHFTPKTREQIEHKMQANYDRYLNDPSFRAEIQMEFEQAVGDG